jgi:flavin reductase
MLRQRFLEGMSRAASSVSIVTTDGPSGRYGVTVSAMTAVSADTPAPSLLVCVNEASRAAGMIRGNGVFCVNLLRHDQALVSDTFAGRIRTSSGDKFEAIAWRKLVTGSPVLDDTLVSFDCQLKQAVLYGTHWILIGEVADIALHDQPRPPLVYAYRVYQEPVPIEVATS